MLGIDVNLNSLPEVLLMKIAAVVVLYNPTDTVFESINSYIDDVDKLFVIDNSERRNKNFLDHLKKNNKVKYIWNKTNKGIAYSYNLVAKKALIEEYNWLLTMDQDSKWPSGMLTKLIQYVENNETDNAGIISPLHKVKGFTLSRFRGSKKVMGVMSSGNLLNLDVYKKVGGFKEEFFIDNVDYEYCLHLYQLGYEVIALGDCVLEHQLGNIKMIEGEAIAIHSPLRNYYITRNTLYLIDMYNDIFPNYMDKRVAEIRNSVIKDIKYGGSPLCYLIYIMRGYIDYKRGKSGKIQSIINSKK